jgi:hypothetical protein
VRQWFLGLGQALPAWSGQREKLDVHLDVYKEFIEEDGSALVKTTAATTSGALIAFNGAHNGQVMTLLTAYRGRMGRLPIAIAARDAARKRVDAAIEGARAAVASVREKDSADELTELKAKRDAIYQRAKDAGWVQDAVKEFTAAAKAVTSLDPAAMAEYLGEKLGAAIDIMLADAVLKAEWVTLNEIADREAELGSVLQKAKAEGRAATVLAAQKSLEAARLELIQKSLERTALFVEAWACLDQLAALERHSKKTALFVPLQTYNDRINTLARAIRDGGLDYLFQLDRMPSARTDRLLAQMEVDIADVRGRRSGDFSEWLSVADSTRAYVRSHRDWYRQDHALAEAHVSAFEDGAHLDLVQATVNSALRKLGSTVGQ